MKEYKLPPDVKQECLWIVRGYERRRRAYRQARREIIDSCAGGLRPVEERQARLEALEDAPDTLRMRAVEHALACVGLDLPADMRKQLQRAMLLNCQDRNTYPYRTVEVPGISAKKFYAEKRTMLTDVAAFLRLF